MALSLAGHLAGILEYMAVERLFEVAADRRYARIVLDTPPTRQAIDFLEAPDRIAVRRVELAIAHIDIVVTELEHVDCLFLALVAARQPRRVRRTTVTNASS